MPGTIVAKGTSVGAMSLVSKDTKPWRIYVGNPAKRLKKRKKDLVILKKQYLKKANDE
jgi:acetyltransferase-like isoleucine patch superfamily enzyme